jgi:hypothetical protein
MNLTDSKPLQPLAFGNVLIVGTKASNFDEELRTHPRVIMWDSQNEHWTNKDLPQNVRAVFVTRWIGHSAFGKILHEARKRRITIFNPEGTGTIARQVKELLSLTPPVEVTIELPQETIVPELQPTKTRTGGYKQAKLHALYPYINYTLGNTANARVLFAKAKELGIETTLASLAQAVGVQRRKVIGTGLKESHPVKPVRAAKQPVDISVQMLDNMVKEMQDIREYLVAVTKENQQLKARIDKFKAALSND